MASFTNASSTVTQSIGLRKITITKALVVLGGGGGEKNESTVPSAKRLDFVQSVYDTIDVQLFYG